MNPLNAKASNEEDEEEHVDEEQFDEFVTNEIHFLNRY